MPNQPRVSGSKGPVNTFEKVVEEISRILGPSGIDSEDVNPADLLSIMKLYSSSSHEWEKYIAKVPEQGEGYCRNLVDGGNGKYNLLILVWRPEEGSRIHDHSKHCCMKILQGCLKETLYSWPDQDLIQNGELSPPEIKRVTDYDENEVSYISNSIGLHSIHNSDPNNFAVSLHLYTPPAKVCQIFDKDTGRASQWRLHENLPLQLDWK